MKRVDTIARVRRAFYVQGWSLKKIVRELHVSRNTVGHSPKARLVVTMIGCVPSAADPMGADAAVAVAQSPALIYGENAPSKSSAAGASGAEAEARPCGACIDLPASPVPSLAALSRADGTAGEGVTVTLETLRTSSHSLQSSVLPSTRNGGARCVAPGRSLVSWL